MTKTVWVCPKCGALYTEPYPADEGTKPCDECGTELKVVVQNEDGIIHLDGKE